MARAPGIARSPRARSPAVVTVALRLWSSDGTLLGRGFIGFLGLRPTSGGSSILGRDALYTLLKDRIKTEFDGRRHAAVPIGPFGSASPKPLASRSPRSSF